MVAVALRAFLPVTVTRTVAVRSSALASTDSTLDASAFSTAATTAASSPTTATRGLAAAVPAHRSNSTMASPHVPSPAATESSTQRAHALDVGAVELGLAERHAGAARRAVAQLLQQQVIAAGRIDQRRAVARLLDRGHAEQPAGRPRRDQIEIGLGLAVVVAVAAAGAALLEELLDVARRALGETLGIGEITGAPRHQQRDHSPCGPAHTSPGSGPRRSIAGALAFFGRTEASPIMSVSTPIACATETSRWLCGKPIFVLSLTQRRGGGGQRLVLVV